MLHYAMDFFGEKLYCNMTIKIITCSFLFLNTNVCVQITQSAGYLYTFYFLPLIFSSSGIYWKFIKPCVVILVNQPSTLTMAVFWVVVPCSLVEISEVLAVLMMEAVNTSETSVNCYQITRCYNPEDSHLQ
jgi:hypothetical protein